MEVVTTEEAATLVGVTPATIRQWVARGHLRPLRAGASPLRFREQEVIDCHAERTSKRWRTEVDRLAEAWRLANE